MSVRLTDDEVLALVGESGRSWPVPLPTVDVDDPSALRAAARRGVRSLYARGLADVVGEGSLALTGDLGFTSDVMDRRALVVTCFVVRDGGSFSGGPNLAVVAKASTALTISVSADGVHSIGLGDTARAVRAVQELAALAFSGGLADVGSLTLLLPAVSGADTVFRVAAGAARRAEAGGHGATEIGLQAVADALQQRLRSVAG